LIYLHLNILKIVKSSLRFKHSKEIFLILIEIQKGINKIDKNYPMFGKIHSKDTIIKISIVKKDTTYILFGTTLSEQATV